MKLLETQISLVEANEGVAIIPSFGTPPCRNHKVTVSALVDPAIDLDFYQISNRCSHLSEDAKEFSGLPKTHIANWAGTSNAQSRAAQLLFPSISYMMLSPGQPTWSSLRSVKTHQGLRR